MASDSSGDGIERSGIVYAVIVEPDGPFPMPGEIMVGGLVPGGHIREIGRVGRKPIKWDCEYEVYGDIVEAVERAAELTYRTTNGWVSDAIEGERQLNTDTGR